MNNPKMTNPKMTNPKKKTKKRTENSENVCPLTLESLKKLPKGERFKACLDPNVYDVKTLAQNIFEHKRIVSPVTKVVISVPDIQRIFDQVNGIEQLYTKDHLKDAMTRSIDAQRQLIPDDSDGDDSDAIDYYIYLSPNNSNNHIYYNLDAWINIDNIYWDRDFEKFLADTRGIRPDPARRLDQHS